jgi:hypothetical protein
MGIQVITRLGKGEPKKIQGPPSKSGKSVAKGSQKGKLESKTPRVGVHHEIYLTETLSLRED